MMVNQPPFLTSIDFDDYLVVTHNNCLIDQDFMDKYTNEELIKQPESKMDDRFENNQLRESYSNF
jgi:hypothetical protein